MAIGVDRVRPYKVEKASDGGDPGDDFESIGPQPANPQEDAIEVAGVFMQDAVDRDEQVYICRDSGQLCLFDVPNPSGFSLTQLASGALPPPEGPCVFLYSEDGISWLQIVPLAGDGILTNDDGQVVYSG